MPDTDTSQMPALSLLVVDDDQDIRDLMAEYLRQHGFLVRVADGGKAMFESIEQEVPDLIVLDIMMPGEDGLSLCRRLRAMDSASSVPVIFLTALGDTADRVGGPGTRRGRLCGQAFPAARASGQNPRRAPPFRRAPGAPADAGRPEKAYHFSGWTLDISARHLIAPGGMVVNLSGAEYRLLTNFS